MSYSEDFERVKMVLSLLPGSRDGEYEFAIEALHRIEGEMDRLRTEGEDLDLGRMLPKWMADLTPREVERLRPLPRTAGC